MAAETPRRRFAWFSKPKQPDPLIGGFTKFPEFSEHVQLQVLSFLDVRDLLSFSLVCCYGYTLSSHDSLWRPVYDARFPPKPARPDPRTGLALCQKAMYAHRLRNPAPGDEVRLVCSSAAGWRCRAIVRHRVRYSRSVQGWDCGRLTRLPLGRHCPLQIQCLWVGSFNLVSGEDITSYEGRAWWQAVVVRQETPTTFLIHYPQVGLCGCGARTT